MHLLRVMRVLVPAAVVLAIVAGVTSVLSARPDIQHAKSAVDTAWTPLGRQLEPRYVFLAAADRQVAALSGPVHELAADVGRALTSWQAARRGGSVASQVQAANTLEALGRRLIATAIASPRVQGSAKQAVITYAQTTVSAASFNDAVQKYERERRGPLRGVVATVLGDDDIPAFAPAVTT
jgi:hypothetical protein